jgi:5-methylcytosine-specific restriction endonuclease McrA
MYGGSNYNRIFQSDGRGPKNYFSTLYCDEEMSEICPFREHTPRPVFKHESIPRPPLVDCPICGRRHFDGSASQIYCQQYGKIKELLAEMEKKNESWAPEGSTEDPFDGTLTDFWQRRLWNNIRSFILKRDNNTCQDCGLKCENGTIAPKSSRIADEKIIWKKDGGHELEWHRIEPGQYQYHGTDSWFELEVHHIIPRCKGGTHHPRNLKTVCDQCHDLYTAELHRENGRERQNEKKAAKVKGMPKLEEYLNKR